MNAHCSCSCCASAILSSRRLLRLLGLIWGSAYGNVCNRIMALLRRYVACLLGLSLCFRTVNHVDDDESNDVTTYPRVCNTWQAGQVGLFDHSYSLPLKGNKVFNLFPLLPLKANN
jgi:hypothetical protein